MKFLIIISTILLTCFIKIGLSQKQIVASFRIANEIDSNLQFMLDDHIKKIESEKDTYILRNGIHFIFISPKYLYNEDIPNRIIDSLYKNISFPPPFNSPGYNVAIMSVLDSCASIRIIEDFSNKIEYFNNDQTIFILSNLKMNISTIDKIDTRTFNIKFVPCGLVVSSTYLFTFEGIYLIDNRRLRSVFR